MHELAEVIDDPHLDAARREAGGQAARGLVVARAIAGGEDEDAHQGVGAAAVWMTVKVLDDTNRSSA